MKKILSLFLIFFAIVDIYGQQELPKSAMNVGLGLGPNYGIVGVKTVIGHKNSGVMFGLGYPPLAFTPSYQIGAQLSYEFLFFNIGYGHYAVLLDSYFREPILLSGTTVVMGAMLSLNKKKSVFVDLGVGNTWANFNNLNFPRWYPFPPSNQFTFILGIGYRLTTKKSS
jgi:hypothetical protein